MNTDLKIIWVGDKNFSKDGFPLYIGYVEDKPIYEVLDTLDGIIAMFEGVYLKDRILVSIKSDVTYPFYYNSIADAKIECQKHLDTFGKDATVNMRLQHKINLSEKIKNFWGKFRG